MTATNLFSFIKEQVSILTVVQEFVTLRRAGGYWKGPCPLHSEKTASFTVSPQREIFYCFGCHQGGDVITFLSLMEQCTPLQAAQQLADRYQIEIPVHLTQNASPQLIEDKARYHSLCETVALWCHEQLAKNLAPRVYLSNRKIDSTRIMSYQLGYFPGGVAQMKQFLQAMAQENILAKDLIEAGIISQGQRALFSPFEERIIFPIADHLGRICGFGGRIFKPGDERPKYYNSRESNYFAKGSLLFGLNVAKKDIQKKERVFLVEGYMDCIAMNQHGYANTIATLGTACTQEHLNTLSRYTPHLSLLYDGDKAGKEAMLRITQLCWEATIDVSIIALEAGDDPASFLAQGKDLTPLIEQAQDIFAFFVRTQTTDFRRKTLQEKLSSVRKIIDIIAKISDSLKQDIILAQAAGELGIPFESLKNEINQSRTGKTEGPGEQEGSVIRANTISSLENKIFFSIMNNAQLLNKDNVEFLTTYLPQPLCAILKKVWAQVKNAMPLTFKEVFECLESSEQHSVSHIMVAFQDDMAPGAFDSLIEQLQKKHWKSIVHDIKLKLTAAKKEGNSEEVNELISTFTQLKKKMLEKDSSN